MKDKLWLFQIPVVILFTLAFYVTERGLQGELKNTFLSERVYPKLQRVMTPVSDFKFAVRGKIAPKNKIVILEVDDEAVTTYGRWPWHRDMIAALLHKTFEAGAKVVGLDIVFSEKDQRVSENMRAMLQGKNLLDSSAIESFETDHDLTRVIQRYSDRLVLGTTSLDQCRPARSFRKIVMREPEGGGAPEKMVDFDPNECQQPIDHPGIADNFPKYWDRLALPGDHFPKTFDPWQTPVLTLLMGLSNLEEYTEVAKHQGYFNAFPDQDHVIRRSALVMFYNGYVMPSLALEMARTGLNENVEVKINSNNHIETIRFANAGRDIPVTAMGSMEINFKGPNRTFPYIAATELLGEQTPEEAAPLAQGSEPTPVPEVAQEAANQVVQAREPAAAESASEAPVSKDSPAPAGTLAPAVPSKKDILKDAYVLLGVTAVGANDWRAFPTDPNSAGVEGHAHILDNLLSGDMLVTGKSGYGSIWMLILMVIGALLFAYAVQRLEAVPALLLAIFSFAGVGYVDMRVMFERNVNWNSAFFYIEMFVIFFVTLSAKYVIEERNKKFVKSAFSKYVAPAVVDSILKDPAKLVVGGEKKDLTIMFSDIRSFTTFSERLDAKVLAAFLNDYLGIMTKIVFANQGTLDKYIGDAIMAFWGAPLDQPNHALHACQAASKMMVALGEHKKRYKEQFGVDVNIGIGINSGPVNVGNMGSTDNFSYTVIGDHVNLSSRLEGLTKEYRVSILTTRFTFDDIQKAGSAYPLHRVLDFVKVKGKKKAVELIQVLEGPMPEEALQKFQEGRTCYTAQKWDEAIEIFKQTAASLATEANGPDGPSEMFIERCEDFKKAPPPEGWDGSWEMHSK